MNKLISIFLKIIGVMLVFVGLVAAYYGPMEIYVFYFFSKGGQFYYDGFGAGSFWFGALAAMNLGYYIIAVLFLPVGIGHLKLRKWAFTLTKLYINFWLGAGILLFGNYILLAPSLFGLKMTPESPQLQPVPIGIFLFIFLVLLPLGGLWFYKSKKVKAVFEEHDSNQYWTERYPFPILALLLLFVILIIALHLAMFFQCVFPVFGQILLGRQSVPVISLCILILGILCYGTARLKQWAWWGSLVILPLLAISTAISFSRYRFYDIILMMNLPAYEMEFIDKITPLHNFHLAVLLAVPLLVASGLAIYSKRYFMTERR